MSTQRLTGYGRLKLADDRCAVAVGQWARGSEVGIATLRSSIAVMGRVLGLREVVGVHLDYLGHDQVTHLDQDYVDAVINMLQTNGVALGSACIVCPDDLGPATRPYSPGHQELLTRLRALPHRQLSIPAGLGLTVLPVNSHDAPCGLKVLPARIRLL